MAKQRIHIDDLRISLPRRMADNARRIAGGFGQEIMKCIADASHGKTGGIRIDRLAVRMVNAGGDEAAIRKRVAEKISDEVKSRFG